MPGCNQKFAGKGGEVSPGVGKDKLKKLSGQGQEKPVPDLQRKTEKVTGQGVRRSPCPACKEKLKKSPGRG